MLISHASRARAASLCIAHSAKVQHAQCRFASLNSSIGRGIRQSRAANQRQDRHSDSSHHWDKEEFRGPRAKGRDGTERDSDDRFSMTRRRERDYDHGRSNISLDDISKEPSENNYRFSIHRRSRGPGLANWGDDHGDSRFQSSNRSPRDEPAKEDFRGNRRSKESPTQTRIEQIREELERLEGQMKQQSAGPDLNAAKQESQQRPAFGKSDLPDVYYPLRPVKQVAPHRIVYSKPGTEFVYGSSAVLAALRCARRKFYKLYIYQPDGAYRHSDGLERRVSVLKAIQKLGLRHNAEVFEVSGNWYAYMSKLSDDRPHNGVVLEASPLPQPPILALRRHDDPSCSHFGVKFAPQQPDEAQINGTNGSTPRFFHAHDTGILGSTEGKMERYPMVVVLDKIKDPGNLGAIIRSAYYFGVDAIILSRSCPSITPVVLKASAGAAENLPIFRVTNPQSFIQESRKNGWKFFAADAPETSDLGDNSNEAQQQKVHQPSSVGRKLYDGPCGLVMGSEDRGLDNKVLNVVDDRVSIISALTRSAVEDAASVDSLNVSVAAALLLQSFLGDATIVQSAQALGPPLTVPEMVKERMEDEEPNLNEMFRRLVQSN